MDLPGDLGGLGLPQPTPPPEGETLWWWCAPQSGIISPLISHSRYEFSY